jgi:adenylate kinase
VAGRLLILGAPGAGKGTQAQRLAERFRIPHISTGDIFRSHTEKGTEFGKQIEDYMNSGRLVPDTLACEIIVKRLSESDCDNGYILDGFPRSVPQAEHLEKLLADKGDSLDAALVLEVPDEEIVGRLTARRTCSGCGKIYNLQFQPPIEDGKCDEVDCEGAELLQRDDDQENTIRRRLEVYHETTEPLTEFYTRKGLRKSVKSGNLTPDEIAAKIEEILMSEGVC